MERSVSLASMSNEMMKRWYVLVFLVHFCPSSPPFSLLSCFIIDLHPTSSSFLLPLPSSSLHLPPPSSIVLLFLQFLFIHHQSPFFSASIYASAGYQLLSPPPPFIIPCLAYWVQNQTDLLFSPTILAVPKVDTEREREIKCWLNIHDCFRHLFCKGHKKRLIKKFTDIATTFCSFCHYTLITFCCRSGCGLREREKE